MQHPGNWCKDRSRPTILKISYECSGATIERSATAIDVLQCLANCRLLDSISYICLCLKLYLTIGVSITSCERSFSNLKLIRSYLRYGDKIVFLLWPKVGYWLWQFFPSRVNFVSVRIEAAVIRRGDEMQHWLLETLGGRAECVAHAIFFTFWQNAC